MEKIIEKEKVAVKKRRVNKRTSKDYLLLLLNIVVVLIVLFPIIYAFLMSVKSPSEIFTKDISLLPSQPTFMNFVNVFKTAPIGRYIFNSFVASIAITLSQVLTAMLAAFAFHFLRFKGRNLLFAVIMSTMMIPGEATIISNFLQVSSWGLRDTMLGLSK